MKKKQKLNRSKLFPRDKTIVKKQWPFAVFPTDDTVKKKKKGKAFFNLVFVWVKNLV